MDKFAAKVIERLAPHTWLLLAALFTATFVIVIIDFHDRDLSPTTYWTLVGLILLAIVCHVVTPYLPVASRVEVHDAARLRDTIAAKVRHFTGTIDIFNIELNT